ncbi:SigE family RNA polymerase sigma factor [Tessaracoccus sp. HDW20]|uniref:SigE family RNA polymerase sigma factor n=1 Tax=Tessaracoccus coleopterorum TaxID=2714950 RepID=UPI0018D46BA6|nr:SigE family RNA polymerase sigma factor [Tessaracoccus coleopterorum]NHB84047.1 SigE family RNA polymerase sigma factor [Tessaracoccus coleopterorum]
MKGNEPDEASVGERLEHGFTEFVATHGAQLRRTAHLLTGGACGADDLVQDTLVKAWLAWRRIDPSTASAYVRRIMVNLATDRWRRRRYESFPGEFAGRPDERSTRDFEASDDRSFILAQLGTLSARERAIIVLRYYHDLTEADVAETLGCSVGTVKSTASRALARLRSRAEAASYTTRSTR